MEECMICLEERTSHQFVVFSCKHKTCTECFPLLIMYSSPCPICDKPIQIENSNLECCKISLAFVFMSCLILYIFNFYLQKN